MTARTSPSRPLLYASTVFLLFAAFAPATSTASPASPVPAATPAVRQAYGALPLSFEANRGQTDNRVRFLLRGRGYRLFLTPTEATIALGNDAQRAAVRMVFAGARRSPTIEGVARRPGRANYFIGRDPAGWRTGVPIYAGVIYRDLYPGINLIYRGAGPLLEYDFVVAPGADPSAIALRFGTADRLEVDAAANLVVRSAGAVIRWRRPHIYQLVNGETRPVSGGYVLRPGNLVGFSVGAFDHARPLVIDPTLVFSTFMGGGSGDAPFGVTTRFGAAYVAGGTYDIGFPGEASSPRAYGGAGDAFVVKFNAAGTALDYMTYLGGSAYEDAEGIGVDSNGNAYIVGRTGSATSFPVLNAAQPNYGGGMYDAYVAKFDPSGILAYATYLGGNNFEEGDAIAVDSTGTAYVTGGTRSANFPVVVGPGAAQVAQGSLKGPLDAFVTALDATGVIRYSTFLGGSDTDIGRGIAVTASQAYVTGITWSNDFPAIVYPAGLPYQPNFRGDADAFVTKVSAAGDYWSYSTYLGGTYLDGGFAVAVSPSGAAYVVGLTYSTDFPLRTPITTTNAGGGDLFVTKLTADGRALHYSTYLGGSGEDQPWGVALDAPGNTLHVTGWTRSSNFPVVNAFQSSYGGGPTDGFVLKINAPGTALVYSSYLGGAGGDSGRAIAVDGSGNAYVTSTTDSATTFPRRNAMQATFGGLADGALTKINAMDSLPVQDGQSATISTAPKAAGDLGVTATLTNNTAGSGTATIQTESTPSTAGTGATFIFDFGGGYLDLKITGADATDVVVANFYYPSTVTGAVESNLKLQYYNGTTWVNVLSSGSSPPTKNTTDNLDGTISGGRFQVVFDNTSTPQITQMTGTLFVFTVNPAGAVAYLAERVNSPAVSLSPGLKRSLTSKLEAAQAALERGNRTAAANQLQAFINEVQAMKRSGQLDGTTADALVAFARQILGAM